MMRSRHAILFPNISLGLALSVFALLSPKAEAAPFKLNLKAKNRVEFQSSATLESFTGKAKSIIAEFDIDLAHLQSSKGTVTVDLRTLDTGIDLRNKHMRENHLQTDSFPSAVFILDRVTSANKLSSSAPTSLTIHGAMSLHRVTHPVSAVGTVQSAPGATAGELQIRTEFPLKITDYGIARPEFLFLKLAEEVKIVVDLTLQPASE